MSNARNLANLLNTSGEIATANVDGRDLSVDGTKLDGIETGATADQTGSEIKTAYEAEVNTNAYTDTEKTKLAGVADSANNYSHPTGAGNEHLPSTVSQTEAGYLDGVTSAIQTQLNGKQASGTYLAQAGSITSGTITTLTSTTANITTVDLGNWTVTESAGVLYFATLGVNKMKLDASGDLTCVGNVTAYGTV